MASSTTCFLHILALFFICFPLANTIDFDYPAVFNFGDSNSDTGGLVAGVGDRLEPPNGQTYFQKPSGRFCDGRLIIDFLSKLPNLMCHSFYFLGRWSSFQVYIDILVFFFCYAFLLQWMQWTCHS